MPLYLQFEIDGHRYLVDARSVAAVLPLPALKPLPGAPVGVAGAANHQGAPVPVIDLTALATGRAAPDRLSTRLVLARYPAPGGERLLGLVAERATSVARLDEKEFSEPGVTAAPWLGGVAPEARGGLAQRVDVVELLPPALRDALFRTAEEAFA